MALLHIRRPINPSLQKHIEELGYPDVYRRLLPNLGDPRASGWVACKTPFAHCHDEHASFAVNFYTGLWTAADSESKASGYSNGNILDFLAVMFADVDISGKLSPNWDRAERHLRHITGFVSRREEMWFQKCFLALRDPSCAIRAQIVLRKPWDLSRLGDLPIGYDAESDAIVFGYYEQPNAQGERGDFITAKIYHTKPGRTHKAEWKDENAIVGNMVWPWNIYKETGTLILCEGEPDAVTLWTHGFPAASGSAGASHFVPPGTWATNGGRQRNTVLAVADKDAAGRVALEKSTSLIRTLRARAGKMEMPDFDGQPGNADVSDFVKHLYSTGMDNRSVVREIYNIVENATIDSGIISPADMEAEDTDFLSIVTGQFMRRKFRTRARISTLIRKPGVQPKEIIIDCPGPSKDAKCQTCSARTDGKVINVQTNSRAALKLQRVRNNIALRRIMGSEYGINPNCWQVNIDFVPHLDIYDVVLTQPSNVYGLDVGAMSASIQAQLQLRVSQPLPEPGRDYIIEGFVEKPEDVSHIIVHITSIADVEETTEIMEAAKGLTTIIDYNTDEPYERIMQMADDLANSVTGIVGRRDLHTMFLLSFFSQSNYEFEGKLFDEGTLDFVVIGDTRTGKSEAIKRLIDWFQVGMVVDMKSATIPGLLGSVGHIGTSQEWTITPGILPLLDSCNGPCVLDEYKKEHGHIIQALALMRSDSKVRIAKAAAQEVPARVSLIILANPQIGKMITETGQQGVEFLTHLFREPEDISRIDAAMCVSQADVSNIEISSKNALSDGRYTHMDWLKLHYWSKSRKANNIIFDDSFMGHVREAGRILSDRYQSEIPLILSADVSMKLVRLSMAIAKLTYSTNDTHQQVIVSLPHLITAVKLLAMWYNKDVFGYDVFSTNIVRSRTIGNTEEVKDILKDCYGDYLPLVIQNMLMRRNFNDSAFSKFAPCSPMHVRRLIQVLMVNRCLVEEKYNMYSLSNAFITLLKELEKEYVIHESTGIPQHV